MLLTSGMISILWLLPWWNGGPFWMYTSWVKQGPGNQIEAGVAKVTQCFSWRSNQPLCGGHSALAFCIFKVLRDSTEELQKLHEISGNKRQHKKTALNIKPDYYLPLGSGTVHIILTQIYCIPVEVSTCPLCRADITSTRTTWPRVKWCFVLSSSIVQHIFL